MLVTLSILLLVSLFGFPAQPGSEALIGTLMVIGATVFFCWWGARVKQVSMDHDKLYVAGLIREISIPFTSIYSISDLQGGWPVIVRLKEKSDFGDTILFLAKWRPLLGGPHPILKELRKLIDESGE